MENSLIFEFSDFDKLFFILISASHFCTSILLSCQQRNAYLTTVKSLGHVTANLCFGFLYLELKVWCKSNQVDQVTIYTTFCFWPKVHNSSFFHSADKMLDIMFKDFMTLLLTICNHDNSKKCKRLFAAYQTGLFEPIDFKKGFDVSMRLLFIIHPARIFSNFSTSP